MLGGSAIAYGSKRQHSVALSSTEAEIMAASLAAAEIVFLRGVLRDMGYDVSKPTPLFVKKQAHATPTAPTSPVHHASFDVEAAYLKGEFEKGEIWYVRPPPGYRHYVRGVPVVWRLKIPLYGEADAGRIWNRTLVKQLQCQDLVQSQYDPCYFRKVKGDGKRVDVLMYSPCPLTLVTLRTTLSTALNP